MSTMNRFKAPTPGAGSLKAASPFAEAFPRTRFK
jgi:hypothetical protein